MSKAAEGATVDHPPYRRYKETQVTEPRMISLIRSWLMEVSKFWYANNMLSRMSFLVMQPRTLPIDPSLPTYLQDNSVPLYFTLTSSISILQTGNFKSFYFLSVRDITPSEHSIHSSPLLTFKSYIKCYLHRPPSQVILLKWALTYLNTQYS